MHLSQEFIPVLSGGAVVWGNLLEVAGGCPGKHPHIVIDPYESLWGGGRLPPLWGFFRKPLSFFLNQNPQ